VVGGGADRGEEGKKNEEVDFLPILPITGRLSGSGHTGGTLSLRFGSNCLLDGGMVKGQIVEFPGLLED
jgi:hypothetical protein